MVLKKRYIILAIIINLIVVGAFSSFCLQTALDFQNKTTVLKEGENVFSKATITPSTYVDWGNGMLNKNAAYATSEFIKVSGGQKVLVGPNTRSIAYYNSSKKFISGAENPSDVTIPSNCVYIRVTCPSTDLGVYEFIRVPKQNDFLLFLPSEICVAVGRTIEIYNSQVAWTGNTDNYHFQWQCDKFKAMKRKFSISATTENVGNFPLTLTVYDNNMRVVAAGSTTIKIVSSTIAKPINVLTIGDSLTNKKPWLDELRRLSSNQFTMVGTRGVPPLSHEGRSGFSAANYLTNTQYTFEGEGVHPFWNGTRFDWNYYKTKTGVNPDAVQIYLGTNGMSIDPRTNVNNIKKIVDYIRQDDKNIPILLVYTLYPGNQDGMGNDIGVNGDAYSKGKWELDEDRKVFNLIVKLNDLLKSYPNLNFVPISVCHDSEYNFGSISTSVNPRASQTEVLPVQAIHPQTQGYLQMADIIFSVLCKIYGS